MRKGVKPERSGIYNSDKWTICRHSYTAGNVNKTHNPSTRTTTRKITLPQLK